MSAFEYFILIRVKEKIVKERGTVCFHGDADDLLKHVPFRTRQICFR